MTADLLPGNFLTTDCSEERVRRRLMIDSSSHIQQMLRPPSISDQFDFYVDCIPS
jgi:hypothetical protein